MDLVGLMNIMNEKDDTARILHVNEEGEIKQLAKVPGQPIIASLLKTALVKDGRAKCLKRSADCTLCGAVMSDRRNLNRHLRMIHGVQPDIRKARIRCSFTEKCGFSCATSIALRHHLETEHGFNIVQRQLYFETRADFDKWKEEEEVNTSSSYVTDTGVKYRNKKKIYYLRCHRSGPIRAEKNLNKERLRSKPQRGYTQCGLTCPSSMQLVENKNGNIDVKYFPNHLGHETDDESVKYMKLRRKEKEEIAAKLVQGMPVREIVTEARIKKGSKLSRVNLLHRRDVYNIKSNVRFLEKEVDHDGKIIDSWIKQISADGVDNNPIALYKPINKNNEYMLVIIHHIQKIIFSVQFDGSIVYIKTKRGKANVDFNLTAMYGINENGDGYPLAFCVSSKIDYSTMATFFQVTREAFGSVTAQIFVSDNISYYYGAWKNVMGEPENKLICNFNILSVWEKKLIELKCPLKKQRALSPILKSMMDETDPVAFESELVQLMNSWNDDDDLKPFLKFFYKFYFKKPSEWANCYRVHSVRKENINKYLEPFHGKLENIYMEGANDLLNALNLILLLIRSECYIGLYKFDEDAVVDKLREIERNHIASKDIADIEFNGVDWVIPNPEFEYSVKKEESTCQKQCNIVCYTCDICVHSYSCNCGDYLANFSICGHIHAVVALTSSKRHDAKYISQEQLLASSALKFSAISLSKSVTEYLEQSDLTDSQYDKIIFDLDKLIKDHSLKDRFEDSCFRKLLWDGS